MKENIKEELKSVLEETTENTTPFYCLANMKVEMLDYTKNPYRTMVEMSLQTWRQYAYKWKELSAEARFEICKLILQKKALPLALEHPTFSFQCLHVDRSTFDQIARARIGIVFASRGQKDDNLHSAGFVLPSVIHGSDYENEVKDVVLKCKDLYVKLVEEYKIPNWAARSILPMYTDHGFIFSANYMAIQNLLSKRLETTEQEGCVALSILIREEIKKKFPLLAEYLRPSCDFTKRDMNAAYNGFSDTVGVPHISDNRQPGYDKEKYPAKWQTPCTNIRHVEFLTGINLPKPEEWKDYSWADLPESDKLLFEEE